MTMRSLWTKVRSRMVAWVSDPTSLSHHESSPKYRWPCNSKLRSWQRFQNTGTYEAEIQSIPSRVYSRRIHAPNTDWIHWAQFQLAITNRLTHRPTFWAVRKMRAIFFRRSTDSSTWGKLRRSKASQVIKLTMTIKSISPTSPGKTVRSMCCKVSFASFCQMKACRGLIILSHGIPSGAQICLRLSSSRSEKPRRKTSWLIRVAWFISNAHKSSKVCRNCAEFWARIRR